MLHSCESRKQVYAKLVFFYRQSVGKWGSWGLPQKTFRDNALLNVVKRPFAKLNAAIFIDDPHAKMENLAHLPIFIEI